MLCSKQPMAIGCYTGRKEGMLAHRKECLLGVVQEGRQAQTAIWCLSSFFFLVLFSSSALGLKSTSVHSSSSRLHCSHPVVNRDLHFRLRGLLPSLAPCEHPKKRKEELRVTSGLGAVPLCRAGGRESARAETSMSAEGVTLSTQLDTPHSTVAPQQPGRHRWHKFSRTA